MTNRLRMAVSRPQRVRNDVTVKTLAASGGLAVGELTETTARKLSAVDGCMEILSNSISKLPNFVMDSRTREHVDHYLLRLLNVRPNEAMTPSIRRKVLENSRNEGFLRLEDVRTRVRLGGQVADYDVSDAACGLYDPLRRLICAVYENYAYLLG